jgi:transposase
MDTSNPAEIPQRGHSEEKPSELKNIGISLMVSSKFNIPLFHETYPGNRNDSKQFNNITDKLKLRLSKVSANIDDMTLVFDKGNNSEHIIDFVENETIAKLNFNGGLRLNQCPEFHDLEIAQYTPLEGDLFHGTLAFRTQKELYGRKFTVIITDNPKFREAQLDRLRANILKCETELGTLQDSLQLREPGTIFRGRKRTSDSVCKNIQEILKAEHMKKLFQYTVEKKDEIVTFTYYLDNSKYYYVVNKCLGKTVLFTNRDDWSSEQIVSTYSSQFHVEEAFKVLKNIKYLSFRPVRHFTDRTITVHAFYYIFGLTLCSLLQLEMDNLGHKLSINALMKEFTNAYQTLIYYLRAPDKKPEVVPVFTKSSQLVETYIEKHNLKRFAFK